MEQTDQVIGEAHEDLVPTARLLPNQFGTESPILGVSQTWDPGFPPSVRLKTRVLLKTRSPSFREPLLFQFPPPKQLEAFRAEAGDHEHCCSSLAAASMLPASCERVGITSLTMGSTLAVLRAVERKIELESHRNMLPKPR